jgi:hypothetical protein
MSIGYTREFPSSPILEQAELGKKVISSEFNIPRDMGKSMKQE